MDEQISPKNNPFGEVYQTLDRHLPYIPEDTCRSHDIDPPYKCRKFLL